MIKTYDLIVIGAGPAGLAAAISARENGVREILVLEREEKMGGILNQCIHNGFGLHTFKEELTGPEYANRYIDKFLDTNIEYKLSTMVREIKKEADDFLLTIVNENGVEDILTHSIILAMGCRERPRGALNIPGYRPAGIYTAGTAQKFVNIDGYLPGKEVVILGSGDIGLIMARRMSLEGAKVKLVAEIMPYSAGLKRNIVQCLNDYDIPLRLSHTITKIYGSDRVEAVEISKVDENLKPIAGTEEKIECDTILLSCGLIPENGLATQLGIDIDPVTKGAIVDSHLMTSQKGVFACGNVLHVHDLVDFVSEEAALAGKSASEYLKQKSLKEDKIKVVAKNRVRYTVPQYVDSNEKITLRFRVDNVYLDKYIVVKDGEEEIFRKKKRFFAPAEMESISLNLDNIKNDHITVSLED